MILLSLPAHAVGRKTLISHGSTKRGQAKIHHAAYDANLLGISPDYVVRINNELMDETDGPMLLHGLQEMDGRGLTLPKRPADRPSKDRLAERFEEFKSAS